MDARTSTFEKDTPIGHPHRNGQAALFVPIPGVQSELPSNLKNGAGIVGFGNPNGTLTVYFESNRFDDSSLKRWEDKVQLAYRRMIDQLPTTSKAVLQPNQLELVGLVQSNSLRLTRFESLQRWLADSSASESAPSSAELSWD
jgi:hypothetical protein